MLDTAACINPRRPLAAEGRALVRAAIRNAAGWPAYRADKGGIDMSEMRAEDLYEACDALGIDVEATLSAGPQEAPKPAAEPRAARRPSSLLELAAEAPTPTPASMPTITPTRAPIIPAPADAAAQLLGLIAGLAPKATMDEERVRDMVATAIGHADDRVERRFEAQAEALAKLLNDALQNGPAIRIELKRGEEVAPVAGHHHPKFATLLKALAARQADSYAPNIWIAGPAGSGKTHAAKTAAHALSVAFHYNGALSMPHELLGFIDAAGNYHRTPFREAYEHGGVYLFDEVDGSDNSALLALNAALANGRASFPDGQIERHKDCYVIATANTWGLGATAEYVGRAKIDAAFLSRFPVRIGWDYDEKLERQISGNESFAKRVQAARAKARTAGLKVLIDPRATIAGAALVAQGFTEAEAAELTFLANLSADQRRIVEA